MPKIKPNILTWARETAGLSPEDAARKLQVKDSKMASALEKLAALEDGAKDISRPMLIKMSKAYRRPLLVFYLDKPPRIGDRGEDFRTLPDHYDSEDNSYIDALIRDIKARQSLVRETLIEEDEEVRIDFVGSITIDQITTQVAQILKNLLNVDLEHFRKQPDHNAAFKLLRQKAEEAGVFIVLKGNLGSHHTNIDVKMFRGFALSDDIAPFIVINDRDARSAWSFTLLHELVHILLGQTGVSGGYAEKRVEKFCNDVSSEFLLPGDEFGSFDISQLSGKDLTEHISQYAFSKKISASQIAYRLYRRGSINKRQWKGLRNFYREQWLDQKAKDKAKSKEKDVRISPYILKRYKLGALVELARRMNYAGALSTTKAGFLLDIKPLKVHRLFETGQPV